MPEFWQWNSQSVEVERKPRRQRMSLRMKPFSPLKVLTNLTMSQGEIFGFLESNRGWIEERLRKWENLIPPPRREGRPGDLYYHMGIPLELRHSLTLLKKSFVAKSETEVCYFHSIHSKVERDSPDYFRRAGDLINRFMAAEAEKVLSARVAVWSAAMGLHPERLRFANQTARWGSCSSRGVVSLNRKLIGAPMHVIDSVVVHELAHLEHMNHSRAFWELVRKYVPDLDAAESWFPDHAHLL